MKITEIENLSRKNMNDLGACIYFICQDSFKSLIKVGFTSNLYSRLAQYKTSSPNGAILIGYIKVDFRGVRANEEMIHDLIYKSGSYRRGEWFSDFPLCSVLNPSYSEFTLCASREQLFTLGLDRINQSLKH